MIESYINKEEVLRYLGYKNQELDQITSTLISDSIEEIRSLIDERYIFEVFDIFRKENKLILKGSNFELKGNDIKKHLKDSQQCILLGVSLGHKVDTRIRYYEKTSMDKALILDACATAAIEEISNRICEEIKRKLKKDNKTLTRRYSPGYGDLPLNIQGDFLSMINAEKEIGLTSTPNSILIPRKSITAIMGVIDIKDEKIKSSCLNCNNYNTCMFSKGDERCGS